MTCNRVVRALFILVLALVAIPLCAQQTGTIVGKVTSSDAQALPGVTVEARSAVLPQPRTTYTGSNGEYRLPALQPGNYIVTFNLSGMQPMTRKVTVLLSQDATVDVRLGMTSVAENITVTAEATLVNRDSTAIASSVSSEQIQALPVGQEYRDLIKLIPAVQYTQDQTRGPSAGGSGQDNVYQFDGVNVTLPLFGTLSAEPASHDIAQISVVKGGAKAKDFDRAGGFTIDSVSKSGTNAFTGQVGLQVETDAMTSDLKTGSNSRYDQDRMWATANLGGPIIQDRLFFYGSYYRPTRERQNRANLYGELPSYDSTRNEGFAKLTYTPTQSFLINGSYRKSNRLDKSDLFGARSAATTGTGFESGLQVGILETSWVINSRSYASFKFTDFKNETQGRPDTVLSAGVSIAPGSRLDIGNLDQAGLLNVPVPIAGNTAFNDFIAPIIAKYGYTDPVTGARTGGGQVGAGTTFDNDDFTRRSGQIGYDVTFGGPVSQDLHFGYQRYTDGEDLRRTSNGFGDISIVGGRSNFSGQPIFYQATFFQQSLGDAVVGSIHSEYQSQNFEVNDTLHVGNWAFNAGVIASNDTLYGQGLKEDESTISGYVGAPGNKYKMYQIPFARMIQPRLGATWAYNGSDTVYTSYARYNPAASSLPRAASWDRNLAGRTLRAYFDQAGTLFGVDPVRSSSGKLFVKDLKPRVVTEYLAGTSQQFTSGWSGRAYGRYRYTNHFWEDTNNDARVKFGAPTGVDQSLYIPDLAARVAQIGSGSSYVIAELDGAFTKYYEGTVESDWHGGRTSLRGSYTWSHYYGNFDQDSSTNFNDANIFIGSSNIADDPGRQLWNNKYGDLRGDRRHLLKAYGTYELPWHATTGAYGLYQSGSPYEIHSYLPYKSLTGSTSDTNRYAEPAGRRKTPDHYQMDLNYTQNIGLIRGFNLQLGVDVYNLFNKQTGYNFENRVGVLGFTTDPNVASIEVPANIPLPTTAPAGSRLIAPYARAFYDPRRIQVSARFQF